MSEECNYSDIETIAQIGDCFTDKVSEIDKVQYDSAVIFGFRYLCFVVLEIVQDPTYKLGSRKLYDIVEAGKNDKSISNNDIPYICVGFSLKEYVKEIYSKKNPCRMPKNGFFCIRNSEATKYLDTFVNFMVQIGIKDKVEIERLPLVLAKCSAIYLYTNHKEEFGHLNNPINFTYEDALAFSTTLFEIQL